MRPVSALFATLALAATALAAAAHEFWISPISYQVEPGGVIAAELRVGQMFSGAAYPFIPANFRRFELMQGERAVSVTARIGDRPALNMPAPGAGLWVVVHETSHNFLTWSEREKFEDFLRHKDALWVLEEHRRRGLPETGFRERYSRYAKSLVAVGDGQGSDREVGLLTEIVALANPYTDDLSKGLPVRVLYEGRPRANAQVEIFARAPDGTVSDSFTRTDAEGVAVIETAPGTEYLIDAVVLRPLEASERSDPVWESLWASLTFRTPD
ncbi:Uncharacterized conserved protein, contains GH25 family domain [Meinhardsimonia xiamenensis]|uniref:Uncharacterized conserved protein, contains GH25 family domain n=1 Tax=Meinhardsimonia xiamenensis TaxID=990712 RepID=A0A1G9EKJ1_9RHOB|nr:DUF4198 domain-containing protein [Meinhardsimonia xiamenensis]PRX33728.1 putative GH25 family protein [Meinhardsimonia xiamenensis]SDK76646.1 Uncharacterized conserved protein, contains GH25 family domain [Meinhardsimonia xiamenensis]